MTNEISSRYIEFANEFSDFGMVFTHGRIVWRLSVVVLIVFAPCTGFNRASLSVAKFSPILLRQRPRNQDR